MRVLYLEDNHKLAKNVSDYLSQFMIVDLVHTLKDAKNSLVGFKYDFLLFDRMINKKDIALNLIEFSRKHGYHTFIITLSSSGEVADKIECLNFGANVCFLRPIHLEELYTKMKSLQRQNSPNIVAVDGLECNVPEQRIYYKKQEIRLTRKESDLFFYLLVNRHRIISQDQLIHALYTHPQEVLVNTIHATIKHIRQKIPIDIIKNIKKRGYTITA